MDISINGDLLRLQEDWLDQFHVSELAEKYSLSRPFSFAVTSQYVESPKRIMIVGQESKDFGPFEDGWPLPAIQEFNIQYTDRQLCRVESGYRYNPSPFWNMFRYMNQNGVTPAWNNVDKLHRIISGKTVPLSAEVERILSGPYGDDRRTLLQREIELTKPNGVYFITGPNYSETMSLALGIDQRLLAEHKPAPSCLCQNITEIAQIGVPVFWSYHPRYLQMQKALAEVANSIITTLRDQYAV